MARSSREGLLSVWEENKYVFLRRGFSYPKRFVYQIEGQFQGRAITSALRFY
jgi:hypothetical protein